jgi:hypothetical protein
MKLPASHAAVIQQERQQLQAVITKDKEDGINGEVRDKEAKLRKLTEQMRSGLSLDEVIQLIGDPDVVQIVTTESHVVSKTRKGSVKEVPLGARMITSYWPRAGVLFDGRNGQGYEVLYLLFDGDRKLERWLWEQPHPRFDGTFGMVRRAKEYWEGKHDKSEAPPVGME